MNVAAKPYDGIHKYIRITDIEESSSSYIDKNVVSPAGNLQDSYIVKPNDILFVRTGASTGKTYLYDRNDGLLYFAGFLIRVNIPNDNPYFVFLQLHTQKYKKWVCIMSTRSGQPGINSQEYSTYSVYLPCIKEQAKIANLLLAIDKRIATQNKIIEKLQSLIKGINDHIQNLIDGESVCFSDLGESYSGLNGKAGNDFGSGKPFVTYMNVYQNTYVSNEEYGSVELSINERQNCVQYGDALFTLSSETPEEVGMGAIYLGSEQELYLNSFCFGVHFNDFDHIFPPYLAYLISSTSFRKSVYPLAQGSTRFNLQKNDFMKMRFIVPKLEIQKKIAKALDSLSNILIMEQQLYQLYTKQKQYLLQQMFI